MKKYQIVLLMLIISISGCSLQKIALRSTTDLMFYGIDAIFEEEDLQIAEQAIASDLKLLEGLYKADPGNNELLLLLTQGYACYSFGFVENKSEGRAKLFYLRARDYGFKLLTRSKAFRDSIPHSEKAFNEKLGTLNKGDLPGLFWTAFAWAGWINLSKDDPKAIFDLGKVKGMMNRVLELDESYFFGSAHLFFGSISGSLPKMLGGDPERAKDHFNRSLALTDNKFLLAYVYLARYYAQPMLDEALYDKYLKIVLQASMDILPEYQLMTAIAKDRAQQLIIKKNDLF